MKFVLNKKRLNIDAHEFLRKNGYGFFTDPTQDKSSYFKSLGRNRYPRLHMYIKETDDAITFDLHLDQKQASYKGARMHNAEHEGEVVEAEIARLKDAIRAALM